jgi:hypothetical protein
VRSAAQFVIGGIGDIGSFNPTMDLTISAMQQEPCLKKLGAPPM